MQVKKFEASTMKEALEMVKTHLGPDAIILSAKGNRNSFGLAGKGSVEVTAAVPENNLRKKQLAESKLNETAKRKFQASSARKQKELIENVYEEFQRESEFQRPKTRVPYVEIPDDDTNLSPTSVGKNVKSLLNRIQSNEVGPNMSSTDSIKESTGRRLQAARVAAEQAAVKPDKNFEMLNQEISRLKTVIEKNQGATKMTMYPGANWGLSYELSYVFENLTAHGIIEEYAFELTEIVQKSLSQPQIKDRALTLGWLYKYILDNTSTVADPYDGRVHVFVGNSGAGKTSSLVKFASQLVVGKKRSVAILTADSLKIGATEQLRIFSKILNVPFAVIRSGQDWEQYLTQFKNIDVLLLDCPGIPLKTPQEVQLLKQYLPPPSVVSTIHFVQSSVYRDSEAFEIGKRYSGIGFKDVIFTSIDEACHHGILYNFQRRFATPIHSFGIGPRMPEDFELASKERILDLIFKLSKQD